MLTSSKNFIAHKNASGVVILLEFIQDVIERRKLRLGPCCIILRI